MTTTEGFAADPQEAESFLAAHPDLERIEVLVPDINGRYRGKWVGPHHLKGIYTAGLSIATSLLFLDAWGRDVTGTGYIYERGDPDGLCLPVPGTLKPVPWAPDKTAQVVLRMMTPEGTPFAGDPRTVLERAVAGFAADGLTPVAACELEFMIYDPAVLTSADDFQRSYREPDRAGIYDHQDLERHGDLLREIGRAADIQGVAADTVISEAAPGQLEVNLIHSDDAVRAADEAQLLKRIIAGIAGRHGLAATFMPKPVAQRSGNGLHVHMSLIDRAGANIFADPDSGETRLGHALSGLLQTMADATALFVPSVNGYRRLSGPYAPNAALWAENNRYTALRLPRAAPAARRFEHRVSGADANPFLVIAAILAGVARGFETETAPPAAVTGDIRAATGAPLPQTLDAALACFSASDWARTHLGAEFIGFYETIRRQELDAYAAVVPQVEFDASL